VITSEFIPQAEEDAALVAQCREGSHDAFRRIVDRYKTLVCSVTYSATGDLARSEDLAQETFVTAWKRLEALREPGRLRSWLCGIARHVIRHEIRQRQRKPLHTAAPLSEAANAAGAEPIPSERAVSAEETALLWSSLERIPEQYREPLILFYREHQSVGRVAEALGLSEDVVKQRLVRGRRLLQAEMLAVIEGVLEKTRPTESFTCGVLGALPVAGSIGAAGLVGGATKTGTFTKVAAGAVSAGAVIWLVFTLSVLGFLAAMGVLLGYLIGRAARRSVRLRMRGAEFWRAITASVGGLIVLPFVVTCFVPGGSIQHPRIYFGLEMLIALFYPALVGAIAWWFVGWRREATLLPPATGGPAFRRWLFIGGVVPVLGFSYLVYTMAFRVTVMSAALAPDAARQIIATRADANYELNVLRNGDRTLWIRVPENGRRLAWYTPYDAVRDDLEARHRPVTTRVEGRDYGQLGWPWKQLGLVAFFLGPLSIAAAAHEFWPRDDAIERDRVRDRAEARLAGWFTVGAKIVAIALAAFLGFGLGIVLLHRMGMMK
jgi:RNA polymerase sigma factor (sigma-70 family)